MADNEIERLMRESFEDPGKADSFYAMLLSSELFVLTAPGAVSEGTRVLEEGTEIDLLNYELDDGTPFIPVFTSLPELQRAIEEELNYISMDGWNLFTLIRGTDVVINLASEYGCHLKPDDIEGILDHFGAEAMTVAREIPVLLGRPADDPLDLKKALSAVFARDPRVQSAYLSLMVNEESQERSLIVGVVFHPGQEYPEIFNIAGPAAGRFVPAGHVLDFMIINARAPEGISGALMHEGECFFQAAVRA